MTELVRSHVCGVTCHQGGENCNGYCTDGRIRAPGIFSIKLINFGQAIEALKAGKKVAREGWNGKGMWLEYIAPQYEVDLPFIRMSYPVNSAAYPLGARVPWLASQTDMLAEDWIVA